MRALEKGGAVDESFMRCLYCGKELAFIKRLTGGAEFCSDAHRKKYQEEFNDLALSRLLQSNPKGAAQPVPVELTEPVATVPHAQLPSVVDDSPEMVGFLTDGPSPPSPGASEIQGGESAILLQPSAIFPTRNFRLDNESRAYSLKWANLVVWESPIQLRLTSFSPRKDNLEAREFSPQTASPLLQFVQEDPSRSRWSPAPVLESLKSATNQPRPPSDSPGLWYAPPLKFSFEPANDSPRLEFEVIQFTSRTASQTPPVAPSKEPPKAHTEPLPVTLQGVSAGIARSVAVIGAALAARIEMPAPAGLPLRQPIVLKSKPVELSSAAAVTEAPVRHRPSSAPENARVVPVKQAPLKAPETKPLPLSPASQLGLPELRAVEDKGIWARMPMAAKLALATGIVLCASGLAYLTLNSANATAKTISAEPRWETASQITAKGWIEDWAPADPLRRVTLLRGTENLSNYRLEFAAQIQTKAVGWMFRGLNPNNYYVAKIEKLKPGLDPVVAFVRYAVIDGKNESRVEKTLPMKVRFDTSYKIRFDAAGSRFSVWVQGEKVDEWEDARLGSGGLGLYSEDDEAPALQGSVNAWELVVERPAGN